MFLLVLAIPLLMAGPASSATWYFLRYNTPSGAKFTGLTGEMVVPPISKAATYYLWPGLQPTDSTGVYQNVLDGRKGNWWFGSGWCCDNPSLPWGGGFSTSPGETNAFSNTLDSDGSNWTTITRHAGTGSSASNSFPLGR
jgi:hypothetical protein